MNNIYTDYGPQPFVVNIQQATRQNTAFRTTLWTGTHLQMTLMSIPVGGEVGLETHPNLDQFIRIEQGHGLVRMGNSEANLNMQMNVMPGSGIFVPAGAWHNLINIGRMPLKLYSVYAPPAHPKGTIHKTKQDAEKAEKH